MPTNRDNVGGSQPAPGTTIAEFLSTIYDSSYVEGESIVSDFLMTLVGLILLIGTPVTY